MGVGVGWGGGRGVWEGMGGELGEDGGVGWDTVGAVLCLALSWQAPPPCYIDLPKPNTQPP